MVVQHDCHHTLFDCMVCSLQSYSPSSKLPQPWSFTTVTLLALLLEANTLQITTFKVLTHLHLNHLNLKHLYKCFYVRNLDSWLFYTKC